MELSEDGSKKIHNGHLCLFGDSPGKRYSHYRDCGKRSIFRALFPIVWAWAIIITSPLTFFVILALIRDIRQNDPLFCSSLVFGFSLFMYFLILYVSVFFRKRTLLRKGKFFFAVEERTIYSWHDLFSLEEDPRLRRRSYAQGLEQLKRFISNLKTGWTKKKKVFHILLVLSGIYLMSDLNIDYYSFWFGLWIILFELVVIPLNLFSKPSNQD